MLLLFLPEEFDGDFKTIGEVACRGETGGAQFVNGGRRVLHVAGAFRGVVDFGARTGQAANGPGEVVDGDPPPVSDVENAGRR